MDSLFDRFLAASHVLQPILVPPEDIVDRHVDPTPLQRLHHSFQSMSSRPTG